jgi:cytochrome c-type biogenesis protein CcmE
MAWARGDDPPKPVPALTPERTMIKNPKVAIGGAVIALAIGFLVATSMSNSSVYYHTVAEFNRGTQATTAHTRVNGVVLEGSIATAATGNQVVFVMHDEHDQKQQLRVMFKGIIPDTFRDGSDVVVEGKMKDGVFEATTLLAKCPSKFTADGV